MKLNQREWGLIDPTQWQRKLSFASKCTTLCCKGKFLVSLSNGQVMKDFIIWKEICMLNVLLLFHKIDSRRMRSRWPNSMTVQAFIYEKCTTSFAKESFWFLIKGSNHEGFYYLNGNMYTECIFAFSQNWIKENEVSLTQFNDSASFICKNVRHLLQRKAFGFLSKGQIMRDFIIWKETWKTLNKEKRR
jgi:hypothetical protein